MGVPPLIHGTRELSSESGAPLLLCSAMIFPTAFSSASRMNLAYGTLLRKSSTGISSYFDKLLLVGSCFTQDLWNTSSSWIVTPRKWLLQFCCTVNKTLPGHLGIPSFVAFTVIKRMLFARRYWNSLLNFFLLLTLRLFDIFTEKDDGQLQVSVDAPAQKASLSHLVIVPASRSALKLVSTAVEGE